MLMAAGLFVSCKDKKEESAGNNALVKDTTATAPPDYEFADAKYTAWGKQRLEQFQNGEMDRWAEQFAADAVYIWSAGDSLAGKKAILDYWRNRRQDVIQNIRFSNDIWLPIKINKPQKGPDLPGVWLLSWYQVDVTYKTGQALTFWVHTDFHYNSKDQIDRAVQYIDRAPINAAAGTK